MPVIVASLLLNTHQVNTKASQKLVIKPIKNRTADAVKALFHNGAMSAIQHCKEIKEYYQRKVGEGKNEIQTADAARY